jgi:hypothetical protein
MEVAKIYGRYDPTRLDWNKIQNLSLNQDERCAVSGLTTEAEKHRLPTALGLAAGRFARTLLGFARRSATVSTANRSTAIAYEKLHGLNGRHSICLLNGT